MLGLSPSASPAEIKKAYREKAKAHHPDLHPGDKHAADFFYRLTQAYEYLNSPQGMAQSPEIVVRPSSVERRPPKFRAPPLKKKVAYASSFAVFVLAVVLGASVNQRGAEPDKNVQREELLTFARQAFANSHFGVCLEVLGGINSRYGSNEEVYKLQQLCAQGDDDKEQKFSLKK